MESQERELVPIPALECGARVAHGEETTPPQAERIAPLENRDGPGVMDDLGDTGHFRRGELPGEHLADGVATLHRALGDLMVHGVVVIEGGEPIRVGGVDRSTQRSTSSFAVMARLSHRPLVRWEVALRWPGGYGW